MSMKSHVDVPDQPPQPELGMFSDLLSGDSSDEEKERELRASLDEKSRELLSTGLAQKYDPTSPEATSHLLGDDASTFQLVAYTCVLLSLVVVSHTLVCT
jgi:hypothetical protein